MEKYQDEKIRHEISNQIKDLELPVEWKPQEVIRYLVRIIEKG